MTLNTPSFFAGVGTVLILLTVGFGGGVLVSGMLSETAPREPNRVERRATATEAAPPAITTKPVPVVTAPTELRPSTPNSGQPTKPLENANALVAEPQDAALAPQQARPVAPAADPAPPLAPQQPVALVNPDQAQDRGEAITQQSKRLADEVKKNGDRRKKVAKPRQRDMRQARQQRAPVGSLAEEDTDSDVRGERPFFMLRERHEFGGPPVFRFFSNDD